MKIKLLLLAVTFAAFSMNAQYVIVDGNGNEFTDGMIAEFDSTVYEDAELQFYVTNNGSETINMRIDFVSSTTGNGDGFQLCFGECFNDLDLGQSVPPMNATPNFIAIGSGITTGQGNHFYNGNPGNGVDIMDFVFRFYETDENGVDIGNELSFTYRYNPTLGTQDFNKLDVTVSSTVITNEMTVKTVEELNMMVYNLQGKVVKNQQLSIGQQTVDMSGLSSQMYIVKFNNNQGASKTVKIVVK